jgi:hypothetical protein
MRCGFENHAALGGNTYPFGDLYFDIERTDDIVTKIWMGSALLYALLDLT